MKRMDYNFAHSAQGMLKQSERLRVGAPAGMEPAACGAACGAGDKPAEEKPAACGSACGAGDRTATEGDACNKQETAEEKPAACGTACGAGEK